MLLREHLLALCWITAIHVTVGYGTISETTTHSQNTITGQETQTSNGNYDEPIQTRDMPLPGYAQENIDDDTIEIPYFETQLSRSGHSLDISYIELPSTKREKRGIHQAKDQWPHIIPYVIDPTFSKHGPGPIQILKRVLQNIMDNVCIIYRDVTTTLDKTNSNWLRENGFKSNSYLRVREGSGCASSSGQGQDGSEMPVLPCHEYKINTHEILHTIYATHTQEIRRRDNYITINRDNIQAAYQYTYDRRASPDFFDEGFDAVSSLLYMNTTWSRNGLETYASIRDDVFDLATTVSSERTVFYELSKVFRCNELYCNNAKVDCGLGYHTLYKGVCQCVCPPEFDSASNCKTLVHSPNNRLTWPRTPMALLAGGPENLCPKGFNSHPGWFTFDGIAKNLQKQVPVLIPSEQKTLSIPVCTNDGPKSEEVDWESWPHGGTFCILKHKISPCGGAFTEFSWWFLSQKTVYVNGSLGDTEVNGNNITLRMCCKKQEPWNMIIDLPNSEPFRLLPVGSCPIVRGMREYQGLLDFYTDTKGASGVLAPSYAFFSREIQFYQCYYLPPQYGCNSHVVLNSRTKSVTITTPGFGVAREPNRRCIYYFDVPSNSKIRITFNKYDLSPDDKFLVKKIYQWQEPLKIDNSHWPEQFISEGEFLLLEYWSSYTTVKNKGASFTADLIIAEEFCYNAATNGDDYVGDTSISETYEECLPWSETTECTDFPTKGITPVRLINANNKCRNVGGELLQPWCYTHVNGTNCRKRYCDVCNLLKVVDVLDKCSDLKDQDSQFCNSGVQRFGCYKTCDYGRWRTTRESCGRPNVPSDGILVGQAKSTYLEGEKVIVKCKTEQLNGTETEMLCTQSGWTDLEHACVECSNGWVSYDDRCFFISPEKLSVRESQKKCESYAPSGTLFQVKNEKDTAFLRKYKQKMKGHYSNTAWISGQRSPNNTWYFTNTNTKIKNFYWSKKHVRRVNNISYKCAIMNGEADSEPGTWKPKGCDTPRDFRNFICQIDNIYKCQDKITTTLCEKTMTLFPGYCTQPRFTASAHENCRKSCGGCAEKTARCQQPPGKHITRTSEAESISTGEVMTFSCKSGFYYVSGDLQRACSSSGVLLGQEPQCKKKPVPVDVNLNAVISRTSTLPAEVVMLLNETRLRVPFNGLIVKWYYYCKTPGTIYFMVFRPKMSLYIYIGSNTVKCVPGWKWSLNVPENDQITVLENDSIAVYSPEKNTLVVNDCSTAPEKIMRNPFAAAKNDTEFYSLQFSGEKYLIPSVGFRVSPGKS